MSAPHITQFSTDEEFAAYAKWYSDKAVEVMRQEQLSDRDFSESHGRMRAALTTLAECMEAAVSFRKEQRTLLRDLSEQRRSERRDARNEQNI